MVESWVSIYGNAFCAQLLICSFCSYSRVYPRTSSSTVCYLPAVASSPPRALTLSGQTLCVWLTSLTAVGCFVPQVWDSTSSRLRADFHRNAHIASVVQWKAPQNFRSAGLVYPGSYLLSRDLSSDYHRRADVSLPGSEWVRVGPSGCDHQVSGSGAASLPIWQSFLRGDFYFFQRQTGIRVPCFVCFV